MTCENCIHLPVCVMRIHWGVGSDWNNRYTPDVEKRCKDFKNKDVVEVKHGEWLKTDAYPHKVYCSLCYKTYVTNEEVIKGRYDNQHSFYCTEAEYCPHCGAKMDLKEGAEE